MVIYSLIKNVTSILDYLSRLSEAFVVSCNPIQTGPTCNFYNVKATKFLFCDFSTKLPGNNLPSLATLKRHTRFFFFNFLIFMCSVKRKFIFLVLNSLAFPTVLVKFYTNH